MFRVISILAIAVTVAGQSLAAHAQRQPNRSEIQVTTGEWPPFTSKAFFAPFTSYGRAADVVLSAFRMAGFEARIQFHSFGDAYELARSGRADASFPFYHTVQRERDMVFSEPLFAVKEVIFYEQERAPRLDDVDTLAGLANVLGTDYRDKVRFVQSYCYVPDIHTAFARECVTRTNGNEPDWRDLPTEIDAFKALLDDRDVLMLPAAKEVGERILQTWFDEEERQRIARIDGLQWPREVFLVAPRNDTGAGLIAKFNAGLRELKTMPKYDALVNAALPEESVLRTVRLGDPGTFPLVVARKEKNSDETIVLPRGTTAKVVEWSSNFLSPERTTLQDQLSQMSRVMITNGPQRGQLLWVQNVFIELD